jgi:hypothetical protein
MGDRAQIKGDCGQRTETRNRAMGHRDRGRETRNIDVRLGTEDGRQGTDQVRQETADRRKGTEPWDTGTEDGRQGTET